MKWIIFTWYLDSPPFGRAINRPHSVEAKSRWICCYDRIWLGWRCDLYHNVHLKYSRLILEIIYSWMLSVELFNTYCIKHNVYDFNNKLLFDLTHWGRETHICVGKLTIIASDNGLSPGRRQAIIWTNAGILLIGPLGTNFNGILI